MMWTCHACGEDNSDSSRSCSSCGEARQALRPGSATAYRPAAKGRVTPGPDELYCLEAQRLRDYANILLVAIAVGGAIFLIASGFVTEFDTLTMKTRTVFQFSRVLKGLAPLAVCIAVGYVFRLLLDALSVITEASYRTMMHKRD